MKKIIGFLVLILFICSAIMCRKKDGDDCPACPSVESISPEIGTGGDTLNIFGKNFAPNPTANTVKINGVQLTSSQILDGNSSSLKVIVPLDCGTGPVTVDVDAELTNFGNPPIFTYRPEFLIDSVIGGTGSDPKACISGQSGGSMTNYVRPMGVAVDPSGNVFFPDEGANCVFKLSPSGNYKSYCLFAGMPFSSGSDDKLGTFASFNEPRYIYLDATNNIFIAENSSKIRVISSGGNVSTWYSHPDLLNANSITFQAGNMNVAYVSLANHTVYKITRTGTVFTQKLIAGKPGVSGFKDGNDTTARLNSPQDIVVDNAGNVFVADENNNAIRKITPAGVVSTFAGNGVPLLMDGLGTQASFNRPRGLFLETDNSIYVADFNNNSIRKITPTGNVTTYYTFNDIMASPNPWDVARDKKGNFFVPFQSSIGNGIKKVIFK